MIAAIDLGTSTSAIGYFAEPPGRPHGQVNLVQGDLGINWVRSSVIYDHLKQTWQAGSTAYNMRLAPERSRYYVVSAKRHLGVSPTIALNGSTSVVVDGREVEVTPQLLLAQVLQHLKQKLEALDPGFDLQKVVVTIPMVYMSHEASLTREAVELAGMELHDFIQEPTAAALCYVHDHVDMARLKDGDVILVFDLGGGTFDITVFKLVASDRDELILDVLATEGVRELGGDDATLVVLDMLKRKGLVLPDVMPSRQRATLLERVENDLKVSLSNGTDPDALTYFHYSEGETNFSAEVTFAEFAGALEESEFAAKLLAACARVADRVGPVDRVMMVGGSSQLPICRKIVQDLFGAPTSFVLNPQEAVVRGAVYRAAQLNGRPTGQRKVTLRNHGVLSHDMGVLSGNPGAERFHTLIGKHTPYPMESALEQRFSLQGDTGEPLVIECAQGDASVPFVRDRSPHLVFDRVNLGHVPVDKPIAIRFQANAYGEILCSSAWEGGGTPPAPLRPRFAE